MSKPIRDDPRETLIAAADLALTTPTAARDRTRRWSDATCREYVTQVQRAREWWETERRTAHQAAAAAGLTTPGPATPATFLPWTSERLLRYVRHLAEQRLAVSTIRKGLTALKAWHRLHGLPVPDGLPASEELQIYEAILAAAGIEAAHAQPVDARTVTALLTACSRDPSRVRGRRDAALIALAVSGMATPADLSAMNRRDAAPGTGGVRIRPDGDRWLTAGHWQPHHPDTCPAEAITAWCAYLDSRQVTAGQPLLRAVDRHTNVAGLDPYAGDVVDGGRLDKRAGNGILRRVAHNADLPAPTMTELRMGGIVLRRAAGADVHRLARDSGIVTLLRYVAAAETSP